MVSTTWILLIYSVPAHPSRLRAAVWREVKRVGATYLRDGVCALPEGGQAGAAFQTIAGKVRSLGGEATVVFGARLEHEAAVEVMAASKAARSAEYAEIAQDVRILLDYLRLEARHRQVGGAELGRLKRDLGKLRAWLDEALSRDYFGANGRDLAQTLLGECARELESFSAGTAAGEKTA